MAKLLYRLGSFVAKNKWLSVIAWVVVLAAIVTPLALNAPDFDDDIEMNDLKSLDTNTKISKEFHQDSEKASMRIVFHSNSENGITEEDTKKDIQKSLDNIRKDDDYVQSISDPYETNQINDDENTAIADISYVVGQSNMKDSSKKVINKELDDLKDKHNIQTEMTNRTLADTDVKGTSEIIGVVVAFVILFITFGSFIVSGMPIMSAIMGLGTSVGIIALLTFAFDIPNLTLTLAVMIGLAVGIDYALFILFRYKEISKKEKNHVKAIGLAVGTAGSAVIFAGITVIIAVCGLALVGIDFLSVMGFASAISVFVAVLSALTLLPALISIFHKFIKTESKRKHKKPKDSVDTPWSKFVVGQPFLAVIVSLVILGLAIIPVFHMRLGMPDDGMKPEDSSAYRAYNLVSEEFGEGYNGQIVMLVNTKDGGSKDDIERDLDNVKSDLEDIDNVDTVAPPVLNANNKYALISIIPDEGPNAVSTNNLVYDLRDYDKQAIDKYNFNTEVSGQSVINIDMSKKLNDAIPVFAGSIVILAFILLMVVFRSILIPLKAVIGFVLSLAATLGFSTLVLQDGFLGSLFGLSTPGPILAFLPVITIGILFGLAIDYELFLMSRVHEEYAATKDNAHSIKVGIKESGPVIVAAALIMFSVFIAFVLQDDIAVKSIGITLGFGVLFDAFIVRMTLIPALTKLFGKASWYIPKWLDFVLPKIDVEGAELQNEITSTSSTDHQKETQTEDFGVRYYQPTIGLDVQTDQLYRDLAENNADHMLLYNALMYYAKHNNKTVYDKHQKNFHVDEGFDSEDDNE